MNSGAGINVKKEWEKFVFPDIRVVKSVGLCIRRVLRNAIPVVKSILF